MNRKLFLLILCFLVGVFTNSVNSFGQTSKACKAKTIVAGCKDNIHKPFKYDSYALSELTFDLKSKQIEVQFTAFQGQKYKIVFCSSGFDENVQMNVYDKSNKIHNNRHQLYDNSKGIDSNFWTFEPAKSGNYFIEYDVPPSMDGKVKKGCIVMLVAYTEEEEDK